MDRRGSLFLAAVLVGLAVCVVSVQAACEKGCDCLTPAEAKKLGYGYCGEKPQVCDDTLAKTVKYCFRKQVTPAPVPVKCDGACSCLDPAKATASGYQYCDTPHAVCGYDDNENPLYCFKKPEPVAVPPATCADGCSCMSPEKATVAGYTYCKGEQVVCDKDTAGNLRYCYGKPVTKGTTTVVPVTTSMRVTPVPRKCSLTCSCLAPEKASAAGYTYCGGEQTLCGYEANKPLYCYGKIPTKAVVKVSTTPTSVVMQEETVPRVEKKTKEVTPLDGFFSGILNRIFGRNSMAQDVPAPDLLPPDAARASSDEDQAGRAQDVPAPDLPPPDAARASSDEDSDCSPGETLCNNVCVDLQSSENHCGACNAPCALTQVCEEGECGEMRVVGVLCPQEWINCGGHCVNPMVNEQHCGNCDMECPEGYNCMVGRCANADGCPPGTALCDQRNCIDIMRSENHCGDCTTHCVGPEHCINGVCDVIGQGGSDCRSDWLLCGLDCVNPMTNPENCGECGHVCGPTKVCLNGQCTCSPDMTACLMPSPFAMGSSGVTFCTHLQHDADNCGACGNACNSDQLCLDGRCTCMDGTEPCDHVCGLVPCDGDCVNIQRNPDHCGGCGNACEAGETCCDGDCVNILSDEENCGRCGATCSGQRNTCCDGDCTNIESRTHCGACNADCGAAEFCVDGPSGHSCCFLVVPWICHPPD